nr:HTH domain-containing protein [Streptomyces sp. NRRL S-1813]
MRASPLLPLVLLLQNRGRLTAGELAEELGVRGRTVYREPTCSGPTSTRTAPSASTWTPGSISGRSPRCPAARPLADTAARALPESR